MVVGSPFLRLAAAGSLLAAAIPAQLTWHRSTDVVGARQGHCGFYDQSRGRVGVVGGQGNQGYVGDLWQLDDGSEWVQRNGVALPARAYGAMCKDVGSQGRWILFGGRNAQGAWLADTWQFVPQALTFAPMTPPTSPSARWLTAMALDTTRGRVVLFGGGDANGARGDTWEWDGATWIPLAILGPPVRTNHAMAFDAARNLTVLFGGRDARPYGDTWLFDGTTLTQAVPPTSPLPVHSAMLAYDPVRQVVVLFGGRDDTDTVHDTTWEWNGTTWTQRTFPVRPTARELASFTYDEQRQRLVLVAGAGQGGGRLDDSWMYDGVVWTKLGPNGAGTLVEPEARRDAMLVYDETNNRTALFGGLTRQGLSWIPLTDTWESAGRVWQQRFPLHSPPASFGGVGTRNRGVGGVTYFPGADSSDVSLEEMWSWDGTDWIGTPLTSPPVSQFVHQTAASLQSSSFGWVFVRRVTTGSGLSWNSAVQIVQPGSGLVVPQAIAGGPPATGGSSFAQPANTAEPSRVFLYGGCEPASGGGESFHGDVWELADVGGGALAWTLLAPAAGSPVPPARSHAAVTMLPAVTHAHGPLIYVAGGRGASGALADAWVFDVNSRLWTAWPVAPTFTPRFGVSATFDSEAIGTTQLASVLLLPQYYSDRGYAGAAVVFGGWDGTTVRGEIFDTMDQNGTAERVTRSTPGVGMALLVHDRASQRTLALDDRYKAMWSFDGSTWSPIVPKGAIPALWYAMLPVGDHVRACFDESIGQTIVCGRGSTYSYSSSGGTWTHRSNGPMGFFGGELYGAAFVYVPSAQRSLWFGGASAFLFVPSGDTWSFDAATNQWSLLATTGPSARAWHGMAVDRLRDRVVLFGGRRNTALLNDTWEWSAATGWQQRSPTTNPPARASHTLVYDEVRGRTVLTGGGFDDLWEWDGTNWTSRTAENPTSFTGNLAQWDTARERTISLTFGPLVVHGIGARIDTAGPGNTVQPEGLRYYSQPVIGGSLRLGFDSPLGVAIYTLGIGPVQQGAQFLPPFFCEPTNLYSVLLIETAFGTAEPNLVWPVPNSPAMLDLTAVVQAFVPQPSGCWRATDALHVRF